MPRWAGALGIYPVGPSGVKIDPWPAAWEDLAGVRSAHGNPLPPIEAASDVTNPLLGPRGATAVFAEQKGAGAAERAQLESHLTRLVERTYARETAERTGAGCMPRPWPARPWPARAQWAWPASRQP